MQKGDMTHADVLEPFIKYIKNEHDESDQKISNAIINIDPKTDLVLKYHVYFEDRLRYLLRLCLNKPDQKYLKKLKFNELIKLTEMMGLFNVFQNEDKSNRVLDDLKKINAVRNEIAHQSLDISPVTFKTYLGVDKYKEMVKMFAGIQGRLSVVCDIAVIDPGMMHYLSYSKGPSHSKSILFDSYSDKAKEHLDMYLKIQSQVTTSLIKK